MYFHHIKYSLCFTAGLYFFLTVALYILDSDGLLIIEVFYLNIILYLILLIYTYKEKTYIYFDFWFSILFPFYFCINFYLYWVSEISIFYFYKENAIHSFYICCSLWSFGIILAVIRPKGYNVNCFFSDFKKYINSYLLCDRSFFILFLLALSCAVFFFSQVSDLSISSFLSQSRLELINQVSQEGWYLKYFIIAYSWFVFGVFFSGDNLIRRLYLFLPVFLYFLSLVFVGSRREIVFVLSYFFIFCLFYSNGNIGYKFKILLISVIFLLIAFGALRYGEEQSSAEFLLNAFGEFVFPINTFIYFVNKGVSSYELGLTYFQLFYNFIPKFFYPDKPLSLAIQFAYMVSLPGQDFIMGYAYTPITEAFVNFGVFSVLILPFLVSSLSYFSEVISIRYPLFSIIMLSQVLNFQRSEISSLLFETILLTMAFVFCDSLSRVKFIK